MGPRRIAAALGVVLAALVTSACSAGQITQTSSQVSGVNGATGRALDIVARDAVIAFPDRPVGEAAYLPGGDAPLRLRLVNEGTGLDRLVSASSPVATAVTITGATSLPGQEVLAIGQNGAAAALGTKQAEIVLAGLRGPLKPGGFRYPVTLVFERAGPMMLELPVGNPGPTG